MASLPVTEPAPPRQQPVQYCCAGSLLVHGAEALHHDVATRMETAMGKGLPQMEVRVSGLSLSAQIPVSSDGDSHQLPTIYNDIKQGLLGKSTIATKRILQNINAVFRPGTMTLVLGQPGSGKSALLKVLSGRFPMSKTITLEGHITYNGVSREAMDKRLPQFVGYVGQRDHHFPTLSVKETLAFAHECCGAELSTRAEQQFVHGTEQQNKIALEAARAMFRHYPELVTHQLGLEHCPDTVVGDAMLRGVSGGERKRVTIGEMEFGNRYATCLDEVSTGLDSAATFDIMSTQRSLATKFHRTVIAALLQPSPEVFSLFDNVLILNEGHVMYYGPRANVVPYFESLGFVCPPDRDVADFVMDLGTDHQWKYFVGHSTNPPQVRRPAEFASAFQTSTHHATVVADVLAPHNTTLLNDVDSHFGDVPEFHEPFWQSVWTLMKRESRIVLRNDALLKGRAAMIGVVGILFATLFYQFNGTQIQLVLGTVFSAILFLAMGQASQVSTFMVVREVFYKQRGANFYSTPAYVLAVSLSQIPIALTETIVFGSMIYWMCGFVANVGEFLVFEFVLFSTTLAFVSWFFFLSAISPNLQVGEPLGTVSLLFFILFAGFIITKDNIPDYFIWAYWFNPFAWCLRALAVNQYRSTDFDVCEIGGVDYCATYDGKKAGEYLLSVFQIQSDREWVWYCVIYMLASFAVFMAVTAYVLENVRYESPDPVSITLTDDEKLEMTKSDDTDLYTLAESPREIAVDLGQTRYERHFIPITLAFKDLHYSVPDPANSKEELELLKGVSGYACPGTMTALMGSSGAGKTTLMDVIAGRKTGGIIRGQILLNGYPSTDLTIRRSTGYCEQIDVHSLSSTIREALMFSAFLRQDSDIPASQKLESVEECLDMLDLRPIADKIIRGSSMEQMKRLTIGVELAAQPSVLFLDEPTSGLDARSAKVIMDGVRKVADSGRTIVCTIHQPSWEVFSVFDSLLLLKRGGETVYFGKIGKDACKMIQYFESIRGVKPVAKGYNPAAWMLDIIGAGVGNTNGDETDFVAAFKASDEKAAMEQLLEREGVTRPAPGSSALTFQTKRAASETTQARLLLKRFMDMYWRTSDYNLVRFAVFVVLAIIFGLAFRNIKYDTYQGINAGIGMIFVTLIFAGVVSFESVLPLASEERPSYYRERASQTYNSLWYLVGSTVAEIPYVFVSTLCLCGIFYPMAGFSGAWRFALFWIGTSLHVLLQTYVGQFLVYALPSIEVAMIAGVMFNGICFLLIGYNPPVESIPGGYQWLHEIVPPKYAFAILGSLVFGECSESGRGPELGCKPLTGELPPDVPQGTTIQQYVDAVFKIKRDDLWVNFAVVVGYIVLFRVFALLALRFINHQKK